MTEYDLHGVYTTVTEYANAHNLTRRGVLWLMEKDNFPYEVVRVGKQLLIKLS